MNEEQLKELAGNLSVLILNECVTNYRTTPTGDLIDSENTGYSDFDEYVHDIIKEYDYLNKDVLSKMKTGPFETDGTDRVRDMIYIMLARYCKFMDETELEGKKNGDKINFRHFAEKLQDTKDKNGSFRNKLKNLVKDYI